MLMIHAADLHLSQEEAGYSLAVLAEIVTLATREKAGALLLAGDVFDSFQDLQRMHGELAAALERLPAACRVLYVMGNHEILRGPQGPAEAMRRMNLGRARLCATEPFSLVSATELDGVEVLAIPHQASYTEYMSWVVPPRTPGVPRVVLAHAALTGASYLGPDTEEVSSVMDVDLLARVGADYAAMGHLHTARAVRLGDVTICYPGSSRVWRRGEEGPRSVAIVRVEPESVRVERAVLATAGEYRRCQVTLDLEAGLPDLDGVARAWGPRDSVEIELSGVVEDENAAVRVQETLRERYASRVRLLEVRLGSVASITGISRNGLAAAFVAAWKQREEELTAAHGPEVARRALRAGLEKIRGVLESRKIALNDGAATP